MKKNYSFIGLMFLVIIILCATTLIQAKKMQVLKNNLSITQKRLVSVNNIVTIGKGQNTKTKTIYKYIISPQTQKEKDDLQVLIKIDTRVRIWFSQNMDYEQYKNRNKKNMTYYDFDLYYLNQMIAK